MQLYIDLHVHSIASADGCSTIDQIIEAARAKGLNGVAITDHDAPMDAALARESSLKHSFIVVPGIEITTAEGHLLVYLPRREFRKGMPFMEAVDQALADGSAVAIPHPTDPVSHGVGVQVAESSSSRRLPLETMNASTLSRYNRSAAKLAERLSLPRIGGSDAHLARAVGDAWTTVDSEGASPESIASAIMAGETSAEGRRTSKAVSIETIIRRTVRKGSEG